jgi:hypothetical protein
MRLTLRLLPAPWPLINHEMAAKLAKRFEKRGQVTSELRKNTKFQIETFFNWSRIAIVIESWLFFSTV